MLLFLCFVLLVLSLVSSFSLLPSSSTTFTKRISINHKVAILFHKKVFHNANQPFSLSSHYSSAVDSQSSKTEPTRFSFLNMIRIPWIVQVLVSTMATVFLFGRRVLAKNLLSKSAGWDLYGRVPYDDWLFSTWTLTDPNLLKRSFVEAITDEVGIVLGNYKHNQRLFELSMLAKGIVVAGLALVAFGRLVKFSQEMGRRQLAREDRLRGFSIPISAVTKGSRRMGRQIEGMDEGFIDMEAYEEDDDADDNNANDNKNKKGKNGKPKGKRPKPEDDDDEED